MQLVHDAFAWGNDIHAIKVIAAPAQKTEALCISFIFNGKINRCRFGISPAINLQRVINHHIGGDRKSTRLNSSHVAISYAVFCLKKKKSTQQTSAKVINRTKSMII